MIKDRLNKKLLYNMMVQDAPIYYHYTYDNIDSVLANFLFDQSPFHDFIDEVLRDVDDESMPKALKNVNTLLTCSKHILRYNKVDLEWFQRSLSRMKNARGSIKNITNCESSPVVG